LHAATVLFNAMTVWDGPTGVQAGFDRDDIRGHCTDGERGTDPGDDVSGSHASVQEQHVDQRTGAGAVAVDLAGFLPERFMRRREHPGRACTCESG
jgi:hypothetical protein